MTAIRVLADDLTGALDTAAAFRGAMPVFIDRPCPELLASVDAEVSVVATPTRDIPNKDLAQYLEPSLEWLRGAEVAFKKVDSLLRGNSFAEVAWLIKHGGFEQAVFAPALPAQGRITLDNTQWVVEKGTERGDVSATRKPVSRSFAETFLHFGLRSSSSSLPGVPGIEVWTPDVVSDADLDLVADAADRKGGGSILWCGSAGLAHALARRRGLAPQGDRPAPLPAEAGPTVLISASHHPVFREQWALLRQRSTPLAVAEHACSEEIAAALESLKQGATDAWFDLSPLAKITPEQAAELLAAHTRHLAAGVPKPGQLVVVGGDTLLGLCRAAGVKALLAQPSIHNGWGCARLMGGAWDGVPCYSRSGAFGGADDLVTLMGLLNHSSQGRKGNSR